MAARLIALTLGVLIAGCSQLGGGSAENYQHLLKMLCAAPPTVLENTVLTTDELRTAWLFICTHADSVPKTPVPAQTMQIAGS